VGVSVIVLAVRFTSRSSKDVVKFFQFMLVTGCLDAWSVVHTIFILQFGFGSRVGFARLCFWCVFFFLAFGFIYQTFVWLCFTTTLCKQFAVFPFWVILDFCVVAGQVYVPRLFVFLFYLLYFPLLKKKIKKNMLIRLNQEIFLHT
jgi:hypothetical protein